MCDERLSKLFALAFVNMVGCMVRDAREDADAVTFQKGRAVWWCVME